MTAVPLAFTIVFSLLGHISEWVVPIAVVITVVLWVVPLSILAAVRHPRAGDQEARIGLVDGHAMGVPGTNPAAVPTLRSLLVGSR